MKTTILVAVHLEHDPKSEEGWLGEVTSEDVASVLNHRVETLDKWFDDEGLELIGFGPR